MRLTARLLALPNSGLNVLLKTNPVNANLMNAVLMKAVFVSAIVVSAIVSTSCTSTPPASKEDQSASANPPPRVKAWMDRLTVKHEYDPTTGFIVARETVALPPSIADAPPLDAAIAQAGSARTVIVFVTADRCAPCQQYKRDALNDPTVIARLSDARFLPTHLEVDRSPTLADAHLGTRSIPMTYALRDGKVIAELRGQRSAADLLAWIDALPE
ncbi:MAG: Thioredoxin-like [Planctomycetota bacterium]